MNSSTATDCTSLLVNTICLTAPLSGIGRYTLEICKRLDKDRELDLTYFYGYFSKELAGHDGCNFVNTMKGAREQLKAFPALRKAARKAMIFYAGLDRSQHEIYWEPNIVPLEKLKQKAKTFTPTIHDLSWYFHSEWHPKERIDFFRDHFWKGIDGAELVITGSEYTRGEIEEVLRIPEKKIKVIHHGIDHSVFRRYSEDQIDSFAQGKGLPENFILFVGTLEPRKNLEKLIQAYRFLPKDIKGEFSLVIAGGKGWKDSRLKELLRNSKDSIHLTGYVSDKDLPLLYNLASVFVYPSLYEGFGIPPIEAMGCGCPVLVSNRTAMPEVCGDAAVYCDPEDVESIAYGLEKILEDKILRKSLSVKGTEKAKQYTWERSAALHREVFKILS